MLQHEKINYFEFPSCNLPETKRFFTEAFAWTFEDYGPEYTAFSGAGLAGGFFTSEKAATTQNGSALIILFSQDLEATQQKIEKAGGKIVQAIYSFPGGRRFHFTEPAGNEFAVWSEPLMDKP